MWGRGGSVGLVSSFRKRIFSLDPLASHPFRALPPLPSLRPGSGAARNKGKTVTLLPPSLPPSCDQVLELPENASVSKQLHELVATLSKKGKAVTLLSSLSSLMSMDGGHRPDHPAHATEVNAAEVLAECRKLAMQV